MFIIDPYKFTSAPAETPPFIMIKETSSSIIYSDDWFQTYTRISGLTFPAALYWNQPSGNGKSFGSYKTSDGYWHYTKDYGANWSTYYLVDSYNIYSDDDCVNMIMGGEEQGGSDFHYYTTNGGTSWQAFPSSLYHQGIYGGRKACISRDGTKCVLNCRSLGFQLNTNSFDSGSWVQVTANINPIRASIIAPDGSAWGAGVYDWAYKAYWDYAFDSSPQSTSISSAKFAGTFYYNGDFYMREYSASPGIYKCNASGYSLYSSTTDWYFGDDSGTKFAKILQSDYSLYYGGNDTGYDCLNVTLPNSAFMSRDGQMLFITSTGDLYHTPDGSTFYDRTSDTNISTTDGRMMECQFNNMLV